MEYYCVPPGWIVLLLSDNRRLESGRIFCTDYQVVREQRKIPADQLRRTILIAQGEYVDLTVYKEEKLVRQRMANRKGQIAHVAAVA